MFEDLIPYATDWGVGQALYTGAGLWVDAVNALEPCFSQTTVLLSYNTDTVTVLQAKH